MTRTTHHIGRDADGNQVDVEIELSHRNGALELTVQAEVYTPRGRWGSDRSLIAAGQCVEDVEAVTAPAAPWTTEDIESLVSVWRAWHLNTMRAGCEHQRAEGWGEDRLPDGRWSGNVYPTGYAERMAAEGRPSWSKPADEHPDGVLCKPCPTCGYEHGSAWLIEDLPEHVIAEVRRLQALAPRRKG